MEFIESTNIQIFGNLYNSVPTMNSPQLLQRWASSTIWNSFQLLQTTPFKIHTCLHSFKYFFNRFVV